MHRDLMNIGIEIAVPMIPKKYGKCSVCVGIHKKSSDSYFFLEMFVMVSLFGGRILLKSDNLLDKLQKSCILGPSILKGRSLIYL